MRNLVGKTLDRYHIESFVAEYRIDTIYEGKDEFLDRRVLLKVANKEEDSHEVLRNEARTMASLRHPHIHVLYDIREVEVEGVKRPMLVLEYLAGGTLAWHVRQNSISRDRIVQVLLEIAEALDFTHRRGFLHRTVTPFQMILDAEGRAYLGGFGLAVGQSPSSRDRVGVAGTPSYMAPEQLEPGQANIGPFTDIWAMGVSLFYGLCGTLPFGAPTNYNELFRAICWDAPPAPRSLDPTTPEALEAICLRCLAKSPGDRYPTAVALAMDLRAWLETQSQPHSQAHGQQVFISHSSKDREFVEREIISVLEGHGIKTWYSKVNIQSAAEWERTLRDGLANSHWFLVVVSPNAIASEWVKDEIHWAIDERPNRIVPVIIEPCDPRELHIRLARIQHVDMTQPTQGSRESLLSSFTS